MPTNMLLRFLHQRRTRSCACNLSGAKSKNYTYLTAETITAEFANETADFIIAP